MTFRFTPLRALAALAITSLLTVGLPAAAQTQPAPATPPAYGAPISLEQAKKAMVAAEAEARKNNWQVVISIVDTGGHLVMLQRLEAQNASVDIATGKARTSVNFRRPTKALEDGLAANGSALRILAVQVSRSCETACPSWSTARSSAASACRA